MILDVGLGLAPTPKMGPRGSNKHDQQLVGLRRVMNLECTSMMPNCCPQMHVWKGC